MDEIGDDPAEDIQDFIDEMEDIAKMRAMHQMIMDSQGTRMAMTTGKKGDKDGGARVYNAWVRRVETEARPRRKKTVWDRLKAKTEQKKVTVWDQLKKKR